MHRRASICRELPASESAPEWVELLPAGPRVEGRDGRKWTLLDAARVIEQSKAYRIVLDWEHGTELRGPIGERAPAAGWIEQLEVRKGAIWGRVDWTPAGAADVKNRAYRFLSPVFLYDPETGEILAIVGAGLTNKPNLELAALNRAGETENTMSLKAIAKAVGIAETASEDEIVAAVNRLKTPSLDLFVPRADYQLALNRATAAENKLAEQAKTQLDAEIERELDAASKAGKIAPASVEFFRASCREDGGLERFRKFAATAPVIAPASGLEGRKPPATEQATNGAQLSDIDLAVCRQMNLDPAEFRKD